MVAGGSRDGGAVSRIRVAVLASASTLALILAIKVPGVVAGITAGSAALAAVAAAWPSPKKMGIIVTR